MGQDQVRSDNDPREEPKDHRPGAPDQLSPSRALEESVGASESQRVGDSGPVANPIVSFPEEPGAGDG
jgi:hypothetical protein